MRRVLIAGMVFNAACWSEATFVTECTTAGHCAPTADSGPDDAGTDDAGTVDAGVFDAGVLDAGVFDAGVFDAGAADGGDLSTWAQVASELFPPAALDPAFTLTAMNIGTNPGLVGGVLTRSGSVICIPYRQGRALEVFPGGGTRFLPETGDGGGGWEGGVLLPDGTVLGVPLDVGEFLLIPPDGGVPRRVEGGLADSGLLPPYFEGGVVTKSGKVLLSNYKGPKFAVFDPVTERVAVLDPITFQGNTDQYAGAVLKADGESAWMVPRQETRLIETTPTGSFDRGTSLSGYAGGILLPNGDVVLAPYAPQQFARVTPTGEVTLAGPVGESFFSSTWSTNGFAYAIQTDGHGGKIAIIDQVGGVNVVAAAAPDGGAAPVFSSSHYGFVAREDGVIVGCPYDASSVLFLTPTTRRTVRREVMLSPWLNKW